MKKMEKIKHYNQKLDEFNACPYCDNDDDTGETFYFACGKDYGHYICKKCDKKFNVRAIDWEVYEVNN